MRQFFTKKELKLKKKRLLMMVACMAVLVLLAGYVILTWPKKVESEAPTVIVESAEKGDVEIYGEYVGRIRAQQFVEVRARVEGYLENMLFAEGTYVTKNQVLFVINQDQYRAKADKARAQLKKDEAQALKAKRDLERIRPLYAQNAASQLDLDNAQAAYETAEASVAMSQADLDQAELELGYTLVRSPLSGHISERNVDLGTLVGPGGKSLLATVVKSDTVLVDFSMTALDYLKSKERNIDIGVRTLHVPGSRTLRLLWRIIPSILIRAMWILPNLRWTLRPEHSPCVPKCRTLTKCCYRGSLQRLSYCWMYVRVLSPFLKRRLPLRKVVHIFL